MITRRLFALSACGALACGVLVSSSLFRPALAADPEAAAPIAALNQALLASMRSGQPTWKCLKISRL